MNVGVADGSTAMAEKIATIWPEIVVMVTAFVVMVVGLSPLLRVRRLTFPLSAAGLLVAAVIAAVGTVAVVKLAILGVGLLMLLTAAELPDESRTEPEHFPRRRFEPGMTSRGEFFAFFLLSLMGAMLCVGSNDLIWLFLALELTSLPTYIMVATGREQLRAQEAGVKYFFLGAFGAAIFLYGFALIYGATGATTFDGIRPVLEEQGLGPIAIVGFVLTLLGLGFKIAAVPMHAYAADVYEGAASPVTAFLAFTPKAAGFLAMILIVGLVGWPLADGPGIGGEVLIWLLWGMAAATMVVGNTLALLQNNVKRVLAYSSIAHSGYMLIGLAAGAPGAGGGILVRDGVAAVLFYLLAYGVMNLGAFAVLAVLKARGEEAETFEDLEGLSSRQPLLSLAMAVCVLSLTGIPPFVGFWAKVFVFGAAISHGLIGLAILGLITSAVGAVYYIRIVAACYLGEGRGEALPATLPARWTGALATTATVVIFSIAVQPLLDGAKVAAKRVGSTGTATETTQPAEPVAKGRPAE